ncbi:MAG: flavodoxin-dependent (E)-4-hydroxy-3-methylbut-2-enyl-diphosphate synthase [Candidatus Omnitrophota bacterium]|nr:flavodoxin-dependent (E)-4-hydroxy-3-methylbut-2-enyl-diphosphate synthase [Candidatus Omnitrophota bacterium]MBU1929610.1 flavodoxin-dependent (E)-4-hydroxy-3-methylbut-2-enyl-diphosphate synthase [Candidatus Omnitrophota bacterium]MBU2034803.1 flavodoxin-dependent (E)-4-hydroxy-3-methylbut-2-enyl-diphosphate synthase [Candidatus Omnitrophota bacterium]MBU2222279.1 flavodoxin-dependent (E)-4-hydroxy-3-methylbut-2-enyl-diphosphate synthase [Candidatus Omnitrophota bacterium]MBU2258545.1 flav
MKIIRHKTKVIKIGDLAIGGYNPVAIQSMVKVKTENASAVVREIKKLESLGCEIIRLAVKDMADAKSLGLIRPKVKIPLVADIHFDYRLALQAIDSGADKIRLNPGNIYKKEEIRQIVKKAKANHIPIRVGANSGSVRDWHRDSKTPGHRSMADLMVKGVLDYIKILEGCGFNDIVISLKASNILDTVEAYQKISKLCAYPLHLGVTATGATATGIIKSSIAIGALLMQGIGDTIRISLSDTPSEEVGAARRILESLGLRRFGPEIISCPTCGRCGVDLIKIVNDINRKMTQFTVHSPQSMDRDRRPSTVDRRQFPTVAIMGCVVNGPGEAKEADLGVAFGKKEGLLFKKGKPVKKVKVDQCVDILMKEISAYAL